MMNRLCAIGALAGMLLMSGCELLHLAGGMAQNAEYQKLIQVLPEYEDLENKSVAVLVNADMVMLYQHPDLARQLATGISLKLQQNVPGIKVTNPDTIASWQYKTSQWNALPYGDLVESLQVDRVVFIELYEYRLNPPGDSYIWEGVVAASVGIIENDGVDLDSFAVVMDVMVEFPPMRNLTRDEAPRERIEQGLMVKFVQDTSRLFYEHIEAKYPDKYQGQVPR